MAHLGLSFASQKGPKNKAAYAIEIMTEAYIL